MRALRYDWLWLMVRWTISGLVLLIAMAAAGQINGVPPSVTSLGGNHTMFNPPGVPASVTSLGPNGFGGPFFNQPFCCINPLFPVNPNPFLFPHRRRFSSFVPIAVPVYTMPYTPVIITQPVDDTMEEGYGPGPTVFDRRTSERSSLGFERRYDERLSRLEEKMEETKPVEARGEAEAPAAEQPATLLVFHDGHTVEVKNYAIVGETLYDFSGQGRHKIPLSDLDLPATQKQNDERGVDFRLPAGT